MKRKSLVKVGEFTLGPKPSTKPTLRKGKKRLTKAKNTTKWTIPKPNTHTLLTQNAAVTQHS